MTRFDFVFDSDSTTPDFCSFFSPFLTSLFIYLCIKRRDYYSFNFCRYFMEKKNYFIYNPYSFCII